VRVFIVVMRFMIFLLLFGDKYAALEKRIQTALSAYPYTSVLCACVHCRYAFSDFSFAVRDQTITIPA